jgi:hypothetical protein
MPKLIESRWQYRDQFRNSPNAVCLRWVHGISGLDAGWYPTATAILADLLEVALARLHLLAAGPA